MADEPRDALRRLEQRLTSASDAAERLIAEAARSAQRDRPPPAGWQIPRAEEERSSTRPGGELEVLTAAVQALRDLIPPEVMERLAAAIRELLRAARALIDFYLERLDRPRPEQSEVRDIPIE